MSQEIFRAFFSACVFGSILFFPLVVAPLVFRVLDGDVASEFLRQLFPRYYLFLIITAGLGAFSSWDHPVQATGLAFISISTIFVRQVAVPQINEWRDLEMDGDKVAGQKFKRAHRATVVLNIAQLFIAGGVLARIAV